MPFLIIFVILTLTSCGKESKSESAPVSQKAQPAPISTSYYVKSDSALVACNDSTRGYLAYVEDSAQFKACLSAGWTVVNVTGKDGSNGANGKDGTNGVAGSAGTNGKDGSPVTSNQWYDPITQKMWVMTTFLTTVAGWNNANSACVSSNYRMPAPAEIQVALIHGLKVAAQGLNNAPTQILANDGHTYVVADGTLGSAATSAQFCIAQ